MGLTHTPVKSYGCLNLPTASVFNFYCLDILCARIGHASEIYSPFEFLDSFLCSFWVSRYIMGFTHTPESKVLVVWICWEVPCSISSVLIYYAPELDILVKSNDHLNFSRTSVVHFQARRYIMGLKHTPESKVGAIRICLELPCSISSVSIYCAPESDIRVKSNVHLNFSRASVVHFQVSRYIMGLQHTLDSKVMVVRICWGLPCLIFSVWIYYAPELDIRGKINDHLNFSKAFVVHLLVFRYIMGLTHTPE